MKFLLSYSEIFIIVCKLLAFFYESSNFNNYINLLRLVRYGGTGLMFLFNEMLRNHQPKERSLNQLRSSLEAMQTTKEGLENELNQELLATLSTKDQLEVDQLNDDIRRLKQDNKKAFAERMRLEAQKNKLGKT